MESGKIVVTVTISGQKQLRPWPIGERAATVERMVLTRSSRKRQQSLRNSLRRKLLLIFQVMITDGSLPGNAPQELTQNTNDLEACTLPTFQSRANHYSASPSARDITQSARVHRMPGSRSQSAQSSVR